MRSFIDMTQMGFQDNSSSMCKPRNFVNFSLVRPYLEFHMCTILSLWHVTGLLGVVNIINLALPGVRMLDNYWIKFIS
jgi:hypothetical protein